MPLAFTNQQILDITRRQLNIVTENNAYTQTLVGLSANQTKLFNVDQANYAFYQFFSQQVRSYENEVAAINGAISAEYTDDYTNPAVSPPPLAPSDLVDSAQLLAGCLFFPSNNLYLIPSIVANVNGYLDSTQNNVWEQLILPYIQSGISGSGGSTTLQSATPTVLNVDDTSQFSNGEPVYVTDGTHFGLFQCVTVSPLSPITVTPGTLTGYFIIPPTGSFSVGATVVDTRSNTNLPFVEMLVTEWKTLINSQISALTLQNDTNSPNVTQNLVALTNANNILTAINAWQASPVAPPSSLIALIPARLTYLATRVTQISSSLGSVIDNGNGTYSDGGTNSSYYNRYKWLDVRINKLTGSLNRYYATSSTSGAINTLLANNTALAGDYSAFFNTAQIIIDDGSDIITVSSTSGFSNGDSITVISESNSPGLSGTIVGIPGPQTMKLSFSVPTSYLTNQTDLARIYKEI